MKKIVNKFTIIGVACLAAFLLLMILLLTVDKTEVVGKPIGLSSLNKAFMVKYFNDTWDVLSDVVLYFSLGFTAGLAIYGVYQLVNKRSLLKVDKDILCTGACIILLLAMWLLFDKVFVVNYRPILIQKVAEPSFPSTHVMLSTFALLVSARILTKRYSTKTLYTILTYVGMSLLVVLCVLGRVLSGLHWATDVLGGFLIGFGLFSLVLGLDKAFEKKEEL